VGPSFRSFRLAPLGLGCARGVLNALAMFALYRAFELASSPSLALFPQVIPRSRWCSLFAGERLTVIRIAGMASAFCGSFACRSRGNFRAIQPPARKRNCLGCACSRPFGIMFGCSVLMSFPRPALRNCLVDARSCCFVTLGILGAKRSPLGLPDAKTTAQSRGNALLDTGAFVLSN